MLDSGTLHHISKTNLGTLQGALTFVVSHLVINEFVVGLMVAHSDTVVVYVARLSSVNVPRTCVAPHQLVLAPFSFYHRNHLK